MTLQQMITSMSRMYPVAMELTVRIDYLNQALVAIEEYFDNFVATSFVTVADQDEYSMPTGITDISQIVSLGVSKSVPPVDRYDYEPWRPGTMLNRPQTYNTYYQLPDTDGVPKLILYPVPTVDNHVVSIIYKAHYEPFDASNLTAVPHFDTRYHIYLVYLANHLLASSGHAPDTDIADINMQRWLSAVEDLEFQRMSRDATNPHKKKDNPWWEIPKSHSAGSVGVNPEDHAV